MDPTRPPSTAKDRAAPSLARRYAAWSLDAALVAIIVVPATIPLWHPHLLAAHEALLEMLEPVLRAMLETMPALPAPDALLADPAVSGAVTGFILALGKALLWALAPLAVAFCVYGAVFEHARGATPGKRMLGLRVTDTAGNPLPGPRHALRQASGALSWLTLNLGHLLAIVPPRHQALHDRIARARVVDERQRPLPHWARAWLCLQAAALCLATAALAFMLRGAVDDLLLRLP